MTFTAQREELNRVGSSSSGPGCPGSGGPSFGCSGFADDCGFARESSRSGSPQVDVSPQMVRAHGYAMASTVWLAVSVKRSQVVRI